MRTKQNNMIYICITVFISVLSIPLNDAKAAYLIPESIKTQAGASYTVMLKHDTAVPVECYLEFGPQKYSIDLFQSGIAALPIPNNSYSIQPKAGDSDIITSLGNGICGFKVDSVSESISWNFSFVDQARETYYACGWATVKPTPPSHVVRYIKVGDVISINCADSDNDLLYCNLYDPENRLIILTERINNRISCFHSIEHSTFSDFGIWKCSIAYKYNMILNEVTYEIIPKGTNIVHTWTNETDNHVNIGCSVTNSTAMASPDYCVMVRPDGKQIIVKPEQATKRYTALDTNLTQDVCALQITQPLEASEKGLWRCEQYALVHGLISSEINAIGGFINVSVESSQYKPEVKLPVDVFAHINSTLAMRCEVPFSSPYCYMRGPDGFMYPVNNARTTTVGVCDFVKEKAQITDNGTWMCAFGRQTGEPDAVYKFEVYIPEPVPIKPEIEEIEAKTAGIVRLGCTTKGLGDYPIKYCRFLSPDGNMYQIENHQTSDRISYEGRGLEYGDCGIVLQDVRASDEGTWSCITRLEKAEIDSEEVYTNVHLTINDNLSVASTLGISFGVVAIVIVGAVFVIHRYHKRRNYQTTTNNSIGLVNQDNQNQDDVFTVDTRTYNATDVVVRYGSGDNNNYFGDGDDRILFDALNSTTQHRI